MANTVQHSLRPAIAMTLCEVLGFDPANVLELRYERTRDGVETVIVTLIDDYIRETRPTENEIAMATSRLKHMRFSLQRVEDEVISG